jgi:hypothetical protein
MRKKEKRGGGRSLLIYIKYMGTWLGCIYDDIIKV